MRAALLDPLAFSGLVAAGVAGLLVTVHLRLLAPATDATSAAALIGLACSGTFVVYGTDRVRGAARDRSVWPERAAFAERHARALRVAIGGAALAAVGCAWLQPPIVWGVCAAVAVLGFFHRRLKTRPAFKIAYLTAAWWAVVVGLPAVLPTSQVAPRTLATVSAATALALFANLLASNSPRGPSRALWIARAAAVTGFGLALSGAPEARSLAFVPAAQAIGLAHSAPSERTRLWWMDGSLAIGSIATLVALTLR